MPTENQIKHINSQFRKRDESHLWPICGKFNITSECIKRLRYLEKHGLVIDDIESYESTLDMMISAVVNDESMWGVENPTINWEQLEI